MGISAMWSVAGVLLFGALAAGAQQQPTSVAADTAAPAAPPVSLAQPLPEAPLPQPPPSRVGSQPGIALPAAKPVIPPPPTLHDRFETWVHSTYRPGLLIPVLADSYYSHLTSSHNEFGSDAAGFGERLGASTAMTEFHLFLNNFALNTLFHQDSSFHALRVGTARERARYAVTRVAVARGDDGRPMFNYSQVISGFAGAALGNAFEPDERRSVGNTLGRAATGLASDAGMNLLHEFWPEIRGLVRRHEPRAVRHVSDQISGKMQEVQQKVEPKKQPPAH